MIEENIKNLFAKIPEKNPYGEKINILAATKTRTVDEIKQAINAGIKSIGENKAQEFRDKYPFFQGFDYRFIGNIQRNKLKYLVGKCSLIESVSDKAVAEDISALSVKLGVTTEVLVEVNLGEESKGGVEKNELLSFCQSVSLLKNVRLKGIMAMLPKADFDSVREKCLQTRRLYDIIKNEFENVSVLSMGTSGDFEIAIAAGSNSVRIGEAIFGKRNY